MNTLAPRARRAPRTLAPLHSLSILALALALAGCERCSKDGGAPGGSAGKPGSSEAPPGPVIVGSDGKSVQAASVITEAMAGEVAGPVPSSGKIKAMTPMKVTCASPGQPVSPSLFGVGFADEDPDLRAGAHRWGGNTTSRYNWKLGDAWSSANDYFWENQQIDSYQVFLGKAEKKGGFAAITVPMIGWVAKDTTSCSFPVSAVGPQDKTDPYRKDCGNGKKPDGKTLLPPGDPSRTSVKMTPDEVGQWVAKIKAEDAKRGKKLVYQYILDNEPALWDSSHRDVHPEPLGYDELLEKTIAYGTAIRKADPDAIIAGPAEWGWSGYFWSAKDAKSGFTLKPDRRAHGDEPLLAWYLKKLAEHEKKTGVRVLDVVDVHLYPQGEGVQGPDPDGGDGGGETDRATNDLRFRTTRSLWDREYKDESWIKEAVYLIPRMKDLIAANYPGRGFQIGEYNFGAEKHIAGGVALAEALGRFAQFGVSHAFYWTYPKKPSPAYWAFRAFRNYDGKGGRFLDRIVPTSAPSGTSVYASKDESGKTWVVVALNFSADRPADASIALDGCAAPKGVTSFLYTGGDQGFVPGAIKADGAKLVGKLPPYSITVIEVTLP